MRTSADDKFLAHQMIQRHVASHDVASSLARRRVRCCNRGRSASIASASISVSSKSGSRLEERALLESVSIAFQSDTGNRLRLIASLNRPGGGGGDVDGLYFSVPHRAPPLLLAFFDDRNRLFERVDGDIGFFLRDHERRRNANRARAAAQEEDAAIEREFDDAIAILRQRTRASSDLSRFPRRSSGRGREHRRRSCASSASPPCFARM